MCNCNNTHGKNLLKIKKKNLCNISLNLFAIENKPQKIFSVRSCKVVLFNLFAFAEPLKHFHVCHGTPINKKLKKHELHVKKETILSSETSTNKQSLQKLKSKIFNDSIVIEFLLQSS